MMLPPPQYPSSHVAGYINKGLPRPPPPRSRSSGNESVARSERSTATFGPGMKVNAVMSNLHSMNSNSGTNLTALNPPSARGEGPTWPARTQSMYRTQPPAPLDLSMGVTGKGDFFADMPYTPTSSKGGDGLQLSPGSDGLGPVIRDFDELDSVVEETAYENRI
ncbi:hypothetical protein CHU98_g12137 [Xylaria longipes]|nr:hypothetical protein CHU98_g12137 [Xylaria longipes]